MCLQLGNFRNPQKSSATSFATVGQARLYMSATCAAPAPKSMPRMKLLWLYRTLAGWLAGSPSCAAWWGGVGRLGGLAGPAENRKREARCAGGSKSPQAGWAASPIQIRPHRRSCAPCHAFATACSSGVGSNVQWQVGGGGGGGGAIISLQSLLKLRGSQLTAANTCSSGHGRLCGRLATRGVEMVQKVPRPPDLALGVHRTGGGGGRSSWNLTHSRPSSRTPIL